MREIEKLMMMKMKMRGFVEAECFIEVKGENKDRLIENKLFFELRTKEKKLSLSVAVTATLRQKCVPSSWGHLWDTFFFSHLSKAKNKILLSFFLVIDGPDQIFESPPHVVCHMGMSPLSIFHR